MYLCLPQFNKRAQNEKVAPRVECCVFNKGASERGLARSIQNFQQATFKMSGPTYLACRHSPTEGRSILLGGGRCSTRARVAMPMK